MQLKTKKLLILVTIITMLFVGESLIASAKQSQFIDNEVTPDLFHIGSFELQINVSETEFSPIEFTVKESAYVNLTIKSLDIGHTFEIAEYGISEEIAANSEIIVEFEANKVGSFTYSSVNCSETGTMIVLDPYVPNLPRPEEIGILFDLKHNSNPASMQTKYSGLVNWTEDYNFDLQINTASFFIDTLLEDVDIILLLEPTINLTTSEIDVVLDYIRGGGGLLIAGSQATAKTNFFKITQPFGFKFSNDTASYINSTDLADPIGETNTANSFFISEFIEHPIITENQYVPITDEVVTNLNYVGPMLEFNETWAEESLATDEIDVIGEVIDCYTIAKGNETIFADKNGNGIVEVNETIGEENTLIATAETVSNGRVVGFGSADVLNKTLMGRFPANSIFVHRTIQWIGKMYAVIETQDYQLSTFIVKKGELIDVTLIIYAQNNTPVDGINITLNILRSSLVEHSLELTPVNETHFNGTIDTTSIKTGTVYVNALAHKRGYGYNTTRDYYIDVYPPDPEPLATPIPYILTFVLSGAVGIAAITFFFIRVVKVPGSKKDIETTEVEEEIEEDDLDEYET